MSRENLPLMLAPMARYTRYPFRALACDYGADITTTELVNVRGLYYHLTRKNNSQVEQLIATSPNENYVGLQIFGGTTEFFGKVAKEIDETFGFKFIELNVGCPKRTVTAIGAGAALLKRLDVLRDILDQLNKNAELPITVKTRLGWDHVVINKVLNVLKDFDIKWLTIHTRLAKDSYQIPAKKEYIREMVSKTEIPIFANGDVFSVQDIQQYVDYGAYGVAIGRKAKTCPHIFSLIENPSSEQKIEALRKFLHYCKESEVKLSHSFVKTVTINLIKGIPYSNRAKLEIQKTRNIEMLSKTIEIIEKLR
ncbi:MAG: tRNA-dihydrouridine synthase family protein [Candidatus Heimdallarchaeaceae archaeon]